MGQYSMLFHFKKPDIVWLWSGFLLCQEVGSVDKLVIDIDVMTTGKSAL